MAALNRLAELQAAPSAELPIKKPGSPTSYAAFDVDEKGAGGGNSNVEIAAHMKLYEPIKSGLDTIARNIAAVEQLQSQDRVAANEKARKEIMAKLEQIMDETTKEAAKIKAQLDNIKRDNESYCKDHPESAKAQMRINLFQTHIRRFHQVMNEYNSTTHEFKQHLQDTVRRQLRIVNRDLREDEVNELVESGRAADVIKEALTRDGERIQDVVNDIEDRHEDIRKLEAQVLEVYELFRDLATLVDLQQESLDVIENRVQNAKEYAYKGEKELVSAEKYQKKARKRKCCILIILVVVLAVVLGPTLAKAFGKL